MAEGGVRYVGWDDRVCILRFQVRSREKNDFQIMDRYAVAGISD
jgi:hypothetical protein